MTGPVLVLREAVHGMSVERYADELRARLPDTEVVAAATPAEERELVTDAAVVTGPTMDESLLDEAERLRLFAGVYAGYGHLPMDAFRERDVAVTTASGVHATNMGEHVLGMLLVFARGFLEGWARQQRNEWRHYQTRELAGSTVTVVGLGAIGTAVVDRLQGFDVETVGVRRSPDAGGPTDEVVGPDDLHDALAHTDYLVLACPLTEETRGLIGASEFETLPSSAVLVNVARGPVVDTDALVAALRWGDVSGAALDVTDPEPLPPEHPLWTFGNVFVTPHNAGHTPQYYARLADIVAENVRRMSEGRSDLHNRVD